MIRVLYIHPVGADGGATRSLSELYQGFPEGTVYGVAISPSGGASSTLAAAGMHVVEAQGIAKWDDTRFGHYRGLRWLILLRELAYLPTTLLAIWRARKLEPFDLIHCNELPVLIPGLIARRWLGVPLIIHVRSLQRGDSGGQITRWISHLLRANAEAIIAIDEAVRRTLPNNLDVTVVHNALSAPVGMSNHSADDEFRIGIVGVLHRAKGVYELVEAVRILRERGVRVRLFVVGRNVHDLSGLRGWLLKRLKFADDVRADLTQLIQDYELGEYVKFTGFVDDIGAIYRALDAVCFPSHADAPGRPVFEAALYGLPAIVAMRDPTDDVIEHGVTGICIDAPCPDLIADAIQSLAADRDMARRMGNVAHARATQRFERSIVAGKILGVYRAVIDARTKRRQGQLSRTSDD